MIGEFVDICRFGLINRRVNHDHNFDRVGYEQYPFGGHGYPGPTIDTFRGAGVDLTHNEPRNLRLLSEHESRRISRLVKIGSVGLIAVATLLIATVAVILIG